MVRRRGGGEMAGGSRLQSSGCAFDSTVQVRVRVRVVRVNIYCRYSIIGQRAVIVAVQ